ncbi:MAG: nitroreductase family protein [Bdellovibrionota bacterium]|nr:nitroreductase family protein [Bdellovibrionota bacterium]
MKRLDFNIENSLEISKGLVSSFEKRRSTRVFSGQKIPEEIIDNAIRVAGLAPSGANKQPWHFAKISDKRTIKKVRELSEIREREFYIEKPNQKWIDDLKHLNVDEDKSFLDNASHIIPVFYENTSVIDGELSKNYYAKESVGIATGMLLSALHLTGVQTLTYTPIKMSFMRDFLGLDKSYKIFIVIIVGISPREYEVPDIVKKSINEISSIYSI